MRVTSTLPFSKSVGDLALVQMHAPESGSQLPAKKQRHMASGLLQQLFVRDVNLGAELQTLQQVN